MIIWQCSDGRELREPISRHLARLERERRAGESKHALRVKAFIAENEEFLARSWCEELNSFPYTELPRIKGKFAWRCAKCGNKAEASIESARKQAPVCEGCKTAERERRRAQERAMHEHNKALGRSFGQTAIAFYLGGLEGVTVTEEVLLDPTRRFRVDISATDTVTGKRFAIEHDSERYHSAEQKRISDAEKDAMMRERYDTVIHVIQGKKDSPASETERYFYSESRLLELEAVIKRLVSDNFDRTADVNIKRDTMRILLMKGYRKRGNTEWHRHILSRLSEDWHAEDNSGYELSDFSPRVYYNALWRCKNCGHSFYAAICNRVRGDECIKCKSRRKRVSPHESFAAIHPDKAKNWAEENDLLPTEVTPSSGYNALWRCAVCGHRWQTPVSVVAQGKYGGCFVCGVELRRRGQYKKVEKLDPISGELLYTYEGITIAKSDGFPKVERAIKSGGVYKGFLWRLKK